MSWMKDVERDYKKYMKSKRPKFPRALGTVALCVVMAAVSALAALLYPGLRDGTIRVSEPKAIVKYLQNVVAGDSQDGQMVDETIPFLENLTAQDRAGRSVLLIQCYDKDRLPFRTGGGVLAFTDRTVLTSYSLAASSRSMEVVTGDRTIAVDRIVAWDDKLDIAVLETAEAVPEEPLALGDRSAVSQGGEVIVSTAGQNSFQRMSVQETASGNAGITLSGTLPRAYGVSAVLDSLGHLAALATEPGQTINASRAVSMDTVQRLYDNRGVGKTPEEFFVELNRAIEYYDQSEPVTLLELLDNPDEYHGKMVRFEAKLEIDKNRNDGYYHYLTVKPDGREYVFGQLNQINCSFEDNPLTDYELGRNTIICGKFYVYRVTPGEYKQSGSDNITDQLATAAGNISQGARDIWNSATATIRDGNTVTASIPVKYFEVLPD